MGSTPKFDLGSATNVKTLPGSPKPSLVKESIVQKDWLTLDSEFFGSYVDPKGKRHEVTKYTFKNRNKIEVSVINYGARVVAMRVPDRRGVVEDIALGFDNLEGYTFYRDQPLGATLGRTSNVIRNASFQLLDQTYHLSKNLDNQHHLNGGRRGFDQQMWRCHVDDKKVVMSHLSVDGDEGYPGDVLARVSFALSEKNEFRIEMEAFSTAPTIINMSNLLYFNLGGHTAGPDEVYKHIVTLNCNCFTPTKEDRTTGEILNVVHTQNDFQIPKVMGKVIGIVPNDGIDQNLCVNCGVYQDDCFVGRAFHPPSGRMLELYSDQKGVNLSTGNSFGNGFRMSMRELQLVQKLSDAEKERRRKEATPVDGRLLLLDKIFAKLSDELKCDDAGYKLICDLMLKLDGSGGIKGCQTPFNTPDEEDQLEEEEEFVLTGKQKRFLENLQRVLSHEVQTKECLWLRESTRQLLNIAVILVPEIPNEEYLKHQHKQSIGGKSKGSVRSTKIPYQRWSDLLIGKDKFLYRSHGGIALRTQNYPGCETFKNFPSCVLKPGETYRHVVTYKFWVRAGNPTKWIRRNTRINAGKQNVETK